MCEPVTIAALATAAASAGTGATVAGLSVGATAALGAAAVAMAGSAYQASASQKAQAKYQGKVADNNALMAEYARQDANQRGGEAAVKAQQETRRLRGAQVTRLAANGLDLNSGTAAAILDDTDYFGQQDAQAIRNNAARQAWGYQVEGQNLTSSAEMYRATAAAEKPWASAVTSLLGSAGQFAAMSGGKAKVK